jgi:hypothetical protein
MKGQLSIEAVKDEFSSVATIEVILDEYTRAKASANNEQLAQVLYGLGFFLSPIEKLILDRLVLLDDWHQEHSELITAIQINEIKMAFNVEVIRCSLEHLPAYLAKDQDIKHSYVKKCMYAIAAQPHPEATRTLEELQKSKDEIIRSLASDQLTRLAGR